MNGFWKKNKRPLREIPLSPWDQVLEVLSVILLLVAIFSVIQAWRILPESLPTHFGPSGTPDAWGGKYTIILLPGISLGLYLLLTVLSHYPHIYNYPCRITEENASAQYRMAQTFMRVLKLEMMALFTYIEWGTIQVALGKAGGLGGWLLPVTMIPIFGTVGVYFYFSIKYK